MEGFGTVEYLYDECSPDLLSFLYGKMVKRKAQQKLDDLVISRHANHADKKAMDKLMKQLQKALGQDDRMSADEFASNIKSFLGAK